MIPYILAAVTFLVWLWTLESLVSDRNDRVIIARGWTALGFGILWGASLI